MRKIISIPIKNVSHFKEKLLAWAQQFEEIVWLDSNIENTNSKYAKYDAVLAIDAHTQISCNYKNAFQKLKKYQTTTNDYIFGYLGYDLKNDIENLNSYNLDGLDFSDLKFFRPKKIFFIKGNTLEIQYLFPFKKEIKLDLKQISSFSNKPVSKQKPISILNRISKKEYGKKVENILKHIRQGNIYEVNFCQEFYAENTSINPLNVYQNLNHISSPPFATFLKFKNHFLLSASPERFVKRQGNTIISQPIKGTAKRLQNKEEDLKLAKKLFNDPKERAENIMIVDLVRNDLSKTAIRGSVQVEELCKIQSFKQVHQLVSTVVSTVETKKNSVEIIKSLFPMGSMTGAPKISAMKIIEEQESTKRGLYSGAVGYFAPNNDFDFNVVIRSILYNENKKYVSFTVGGAITSKSVVEKEYEECLLKADAMKKALNTPFI